MPTRKKITTRPAKKKPKATQRRAVKQPAAVKPKVPTLKSMPFVWRYETHVQAVGLWVDELVWAANDAGEIFALAKDGSLERSFKLPKSVHCLLADEAWKYAGCNDGKVYDLTGRQPRAMYEVGTNVGIDWLEVYRGTLIVSDHKGGLSVVDVEGNPKWTKKDAKAKEGWMVRAEGSGIYHGSNAGVRAYDWDGKLQWSVDTGDVRFGWMEGDELVVTGGYMKSKQTQTNLCVVTKQGKLRLKIPIDAHRADHTPNGAESCAAGGGRLFASTGGYVFCYDNDGNPLWQGATGTGSACTMQLIEDLLYVVTSEGTIGCIDVSKASIERALTGSVPKARVAKKAKVEEAETKLETVSDAGKGVVVECVKEGGKLRVKVVSDGYNSSWFCQFPRDLREEGARYVVDEVREATQGGFYRVLGDIKRLQ